MNYQETPTCTEIRPCTLTMAPDGTPMHARDCTAYTGEIRRGWSPYSSAGTVYAVRCADGRIRRATFLRDADTFWTVPARVTVHGRTVTGHVYADTLRPIGEWQFSPYAYLSNARELPEWPEMTR